jgi:hypothetical protein
VPPHALAAPSPPDFPGPPTPSPLAADTKHQRAERLGLQARHWRDSGEPGAFRPRAPSRAEHLVVDEFGLYVPRLDVVPVAVGEAEEAGLGTDVPEASKYCSAFAVPPVVLVSVHERTSELRMETSA